MWIECRSVVAHIREVTRADLLYIRGAARGDAGSLRDALAAYDRYLRLEPGTLRWGVT